MASSSSSTTSNTILVPSSQTMLFSAYLCAKDDADRYVRDMLLSSCNPVARQHSGALEFVTAGL